MIKTERKENYNDSIINQSLARKNMNKSIHYDKQINKTKPDEGTYNSPNKTIKLDSKLSNYTNVSTVDSNT